jgi:hypothetical protein
MNTEMTDEQRIAPCRIHYEAWATSAGFPSLEVALATGRRTTHCGLPTVEGGFLFLFRSGILLAVLEAVLPVFHEDGSHEAWGDRDVPWNRGVSLGPRSAYP